MSHIYNFKFSTSHIKKSKEKVQIKFNNVIYLTQYFWNIILISNQYKIINEILAFFCTQFSKSNADFTLIAPLSSMSYILSSQ